MTIPCPERRRSGRAGRTWAALGLYAVLAAGLMWPVPLYLASRVPGTATWAFDEYTFLWNNWYLRHALLDLHASPLHTNLIWFPLGIDLILYTFNFVNAALALPLQLAFNLPLASNVTLLLATALSGLGAYLLALFVLAGPGRPPGPSQSRMATIRRIEPAELRALGRAPRAVVGRGNIAPGQAVAEEPGATQRSGLERIRLLGRTGFRVGWPVYLAALLAGIIYAAGSNRAVYAALGHYNFATSQWLPFYALYLLKTLRQSRLQNAVLAGLFFALAALTEMTFATFLGLLTLVILLVEWGNLRRQWAGVAGGLRSLAMRLALAGGVALLIWLPVLVPVGREFLSGGYGTEGWGDSVPLSADLAGFVTPSNLNPLLSPPPAAPLASAPAGGERSGWQAELRAIQEGKGHFADVNTVFLGYLTLALAVLGALLVATRRLARPWTWSAIVFGLLSLGPLLQINGKFRFNLDNLVPGGVTLPLPAALLHYVPILNANRAPNRYSLILMLALAVLAALGAWPILSWAERGRANSARIRPAWLLGGIIGVVLVVEHLAAPLPTTDARVPDIYRQIADEPGQFSILQLPLGWRTSYETLGDENTQLQYYQSVHGKSVLGGNISRAPADKLAYFDRIPLFHALTLLERYQPVPPEVDAAARAQAGALAALYDIRYLITFPPVSGRFPYQDTWQRVQEYALQVLPVEPAAFWEGGGVRAYRVKQPAVSFPFRLDLGTPGTEPYLGAGWDAKLLDDPYGNSATWIDGRTADLYLPLGAPTDATLRLSLAPLAYPGAPAQTLTMHVNGTRVLDRQPLAEGWQTVSAPVPAAVTRRGPNTVRLEFGTAVSPRQVTPDPSGRGVIGETGIVSPANIDAHGFSEAYISVFDRAGAETKASTSRRGYNVAVIDPRSGAVLDMQGFDTAANRYEADRLAGYLAGIHPGQIVALATKGDAGAHVTPEVIAGLRGVGSRVASAADLAGQAHALIGVQGAAPGTAAETLNPTDAFARVAGDFRTLSAAVDWVELGP